MKWIPVLVLNGKIDVVIEWRKNDWTARAFGFAIGQWFLGLIVFKRIKKEK
jgi:type IV secretory pathway TrbD component